ncbi:unnamed protein product, partial [Adineta ricciae]
MASNMNQDLEQHRRIIFIHDLNPNTDRETLKRYVSTYSNRIERLTVPRDEKGRSKLHGIVTFFDKESVDAVMKDRVHVIDNKQVFIHRSVPMQASAKANQGIQQLIVSTLDNRTLFERDIRDHFRTYGRIEHINKLHQNGTVWSIHFDYYDAVHQAILASPHRVRQVDVDVKIGERNMTARQFPADTQENELNDAFEAKPKYRPPRSNVTINEEVSSFTLPDQLYCIHITNLPRGIDAETLSKTFDWDVYDILMNPCDNDLSVKTECWLKNANGEEEIDNFIRRWNRKSIDGLIIQCEKKEDQFELCTKFQIGQCGYGANCYWDHIPCTANGTCASACPYGHEQGMKTVPNPSDGEKPTPVVYRIKLSGFRAPVSPEYLNRWFGANNKYYIDSKHNCNAYIVNIKSIKYAKQLMKKWNNQNSDGQTIKCQLELSPILFNRSRSETQSMNRDRARSRPQDATSLRSDSDHCTRDITLKPLNNNEIKELDRDTRLFAEPIRNVIHAQFQTKKRSLPSDAPSDEWEVTSKATNSDDKVLLIRHVKNSNRLGVIKIYSSQSSNSADVHRELIIMKRLKDVQGVSHLIEP